MFLSIESGSENNGNDQNRESNSDTDNRLDHGWLHSCKAVTNIRVALRRRQNVDTAMPDRDPFYTALRQQQELPAQIWPSASEGRRDGCDTCPPVDVIPMATQFDESGRADVQRVRIAMPRGRVDRQQPLQPDGLATEVNRLRARSDFRTTRL
jgi:hypothetical protein